MVHVPRYIPLLSRLAGDSISKSTDLVAPVVEYVPH